MNITAELNNKELTIVVGDEQKRKVYFLHRRNAFYRYV